ncbi:MAG: putative inorganic carbon transporter subunit DabA [Ilumatobacter sp.]|uniref:putative inorganic carbon transporter subunit DabA n=1 Tax=Ilumatobacter sp. TaxID=1967498 RepID=UPI00329A18F0
MAVSCGVACVASLAVVLLSGLNDDGGVGDVAGLALGVDRASAVLLAVVTGTGVVVASFSRRNVDVDPRACRFFVLFGVLVAGSALVVVPGGAGALVVGWGGSGWALVGLVGHRGELASARRAQRRTAITLVVGDIALLAAIAIAVAASGDLAVRSVGSVLADLNSTSLLGASAADVVAVLLVLAGASRSALMPFHRWLVSTLGAPTPVSALVHAGFVSGAGLLIIRFGPLVLGSFFAVHVAFALAAATVLTAIGAGGTRADVKGKLAWSTVAQMGFMVLQCTVGAFSSAVFHIAGHGMYKASLFLGAGDAISSSLRSTRRAAALPVPSASVRRVTVLAIASVSVGAGLLLVTPDVSDGGVILIAVFAWLTVAHGAWGWLSRGAAAWPTSVAHAGTGAVIAVFAYLAGLRAVEEFVKPSFATLGENAGVSSTTLLITLGVVAVGASIWHVAHGPSIERARQGVRSWLARTAHPSVAGDLPIGRSRALRLAPGVLVSSASATTDSTVRVDDLRRSQIRADVARAGNVIAPLWPLTSVVAVNPLGGLEHLGFDAATALARTQFRARTHLSLDEFRSDHALGLTTDDDLAWAINSTYPDVCVTPPINVGDRSIPMAKIIEADLRHGPPDNGSNPARTALERYEGDIDTLGTLIDATISFTAANYVAAAPSPDDSDSFATRWRLDAVTVSALRHHLTTGAVDWLANLAGDPAGVIDAAFATAGVADDERIAEMRGHLSRIQGWAGYAKWRTDWAHPTATRPSLAPIELVAARAALEAAILLSATTAGPDAADEPAPIAAGGRSGRIDTICSALDVRDAGPDVRAEIDCVLEQVDTIGRQSGWLRAQERRVDVEMLSMLDRLDPGDPIREPDAQLVFCIDVRSEGLRRHIEATGPYDTLGFAGFFGVATSVQRIEWEHAEARCPVLVSPSMLATERPVGSSDQDGATPAIAQMLARDRRSAAATAMHARTKTGSGASFVMAEAAGWLLGPLAATRTLMPPRRSTTSRPATVMALEQAADLGSDLEQRTFIAEAVLRTMGLTKDFASLVVLCGHASHNVNNPHATALDCGACAGASGQDSARTVANLLNDADVRVGLRDRGIDIPTGTHFASALHETVSDAVEILDRHAIPATHQPLIDRLDADLATAGARQAAMRARHLPGRTTTVRERGNDWAQVRPEWGLARNAAFIIGPRSMTSGLDLDGRAFLHTYDSNSDPDGKVLETIMTAPLVVAHWISAQYYFSTVDPEVFGAGDKLIHNITANTGVISGEAGDLRVGLPYQSTHVGTQRHHQPVRLLAMIQAPIERIERIIADNPVLTTLVAGSWIRIAGRSHPHERWSMRTPGGTWSAEPRPIPTDRTLETT